MLNPTSRATVALLAALTALGPLATDMYLPAMPAMRESLATGADEIQLTLSLYLIGFAVAQLLCGPLSDRYGRKPVLLGGMLLFLVASLVCAFAPDVEVLLAGRFLQALGGAAGPVLGRAAVRDIYGPFEASRILSYMASVMALAPALAPLFGATLLLWFGWYSIFISLAIYAAAMVALISILPEPLASDQRQSIRPSALFATFRMLIGQRDFVGYTLTNSFAFCGLFAFLSGSSFVLIDFLGVTPNQYGALFAMIVAGFFIGSMASAKLSRRLSRHNLLVIATMLSAVGGGVMAILSLTELHSVWAVIAPHMLFMVGFGIIMPQTMGGALAPNPQCAGSASALFGFVQMSIAAIAGGLVGVFHDGTSQSMAIAIGLAGLGSLASYHLIVRQPSSSSACPAGTA
ncbi:multidrug effflux MFS transporter [Halomonas cupida]|uniref:multidrug effflux MFS transporter n=1 Tax=Halomonas cupida TaxID=44933 RepID=UPI003A92A457